MNFSKKITLGGSIPNKAPIGQGGSQILAPTLWNVTHPWALSTHKDLAISTKPYSNAMI
jgi:hypothetical protein